MRILDVMRKTTWEHSACTQNDLVIKTHFEKENNSRTLETVRMQHGHIKTCSQICKIGITIKPLTNILATIINNARTLATLEEGNKQTHVGSLVKIPISVKENNCRVVLDCTRSRKIGCKHTCEGETIIRLSMHDGKAR